MGGAILRCCSGNDCTAGLLTTGLYGACRTSTQRSIRLGSSWSEQTDWISRQLRCQVTAQLSKCPRWRSGASNAAIADIGSLSNLADKLDLRYECMGKLPPIVPEWIDRSFFELEILSAGTLVGRSYSPQVQRRSSMRIVELLKRVHGEERQQILNVSAEFMASGNCLGPSPVM